MFTDEMETQESEMRLCHVRTCGTLKRGFSIPVQAISKHSTVSQELKHHEVKMYGRVDTLL
jgi:uncharacterized protein YneR